jgi:hypothetical protein
MLYVLWNLLQVMPQTKDAIDTAVGGSVQKIKRRVRYLFSLGGQVFFTGIIYDCMHVCVCVCVCVCVYYTY